LKTLKTTEMKNNTENTAGGDCLHRLVGPLNLWLQWYGDGTPEDDGEVCESEVTWCRDKIFDADVEYVCADEIRRALRGHRRSELWGNNGLIAATMRCVTAIGLIEDALNADEGMDDDLMKSIRSILWPNKQLSEHGKD
jgi:hypothetical protein